MGMMFIKNLLNIVKKNLRSFLKNENILFLVNNFWFRNLIIGFLILLIAYNSFPFIVIFINSLSKEGLFIFFQLLLWISVIIILLFSYYILLVIANILDGNNGVVIYKNLAGKTSDSKTSDSKTSDSKTSDVKTSDSKKSLNCFEIINLVFLKTLKKYFKVDVKTSDSKTSDSKTSDSKKSLNFFEIKELVFQTMIKKYFKVEVDFSKVKVNFISCTIDQFKKLHLPFPFKYTLNDTILEHGALYMNWKRKWIYLINEIMVITYVDEFYSQNCRVIIYYKFDYTLDIYVLNSSLEFNNSFSLIINSLETYIQFIEKNWETYFYDNSGKKLKNYSFNLKIIHINNLNELNFNFLSVYLNFKGVESFFEEDASWKSIITFSINEYRYIHYFNESISLHQIFIIKY